MGHRVSGDQTSGSLFASPTRCLWNIIKASPIKRPCSSERGLTRIKSEPHTLSSSATIFLSDLDAVKTEEFVFLARRRDDLEDYGVELSLPSVKRGFIAAPVCKLDHLHAPFADRGVIGNLHGHLKGIS